MSDYLIFGTVLRGKAKKGLCGNVMQPATKGAALGQPQEMPLWGWHGYRARGLHKDAESPTWGRLQRKLINAWRADCPSLMSGEGVVSGERDCDLPTYLHGLWEIRNP